MCAIVDANVCNEVFGRNQSPAGKKFYDWIIAGSERLVVGGKLLNELELGSPDFREVAQAFGEAGKIRIVNGNLINARAEELKNECVSNDSHIIALAQISGARLLFTNESGNKSTGLVADFKNKRLIDKPRGKIYSTLKTKEFTDSQKRLLGQRDLCLR